MKTRATSIVALAGLAALLAGLAWLDAHRGGPATMLSRCNLALTRADAPAADVLLIGSSRSGVAFDPVALETLLRRNLPDSPSVDRLAIGNITLRLSGALLESYLRHRGAPKVVVLEATVMTPRTIRRLAPVAGGKPPEHYLLARDLNLMSFAQLVTQPAVAMPYTEAERPATLWHLRLRSTVSRAGALVYQFAKAPFDGWSVTACDREDITREPLWPQDFSFSYNDYVIEGALPEAIAALRADVIAGTQARALQDWQEAQPDGQVYPYDIDAAYRQGEMRYLREMLRAARAAGAYVLVLPMPLYGYDIAPDDLASLAALLPEPVETFDIYADIGADFSTYWYDDAHIEKSPTGVLTTALLAQRLVALLGEGAGGD